jgi:hypothetical protein
LIKRKNLIFKTEFGIILFQYADKGTFFGHEGMVVRAALTSIDNNKNVSRAQATTSDGTARFNAISRRL